MSFRIRTNRSQRGAMRHAQGKNRRFAATVGATLVALLAILFTGAAMAQAMEDRDGDGIIDTRDNCLIHANPDQTDRNGNGFGDICDGDFDDDGVVTGLDFSILISSFNRIEDSSVDMNGDGVVDGLDFSFFVSRFNLPPGPGPLAPPEQGNTVATTRTELGLIPDVDGEPIEATYEVDAARGIVRYQGDMIFDLAELREFQATATPPTTSDGIGSTTQPFASATSNFSTWPAGVLVYDADSIDQFETRCRVCDAGTCDANFNGMFEPPLETCDETQADWIDMAIAEWNQETDLEVRPRGPEDEDYVTFVLDTNECLAEVGYKARIQNIWLRPSCTKGNIIHEIGHAFGFRHEQARDDRDAYVEVFEDQIQSGSEDNFDRGAQPWGPYDYRSIMHYGPRFFGIRDAAGIQAQTIESLFSLPSGILGQRVGLSKLDIRAADAVAARAQGFPMAFGDRALYESAVSSMPTGGGSVEQVEAVYVDRDEYVDLVGFGDGEVHVALGGPAGAFEPSRVWRSDSCEAEKSCALGDVTGDGRADLVQFDSRTSDIVVSRATDDSFLGGALWGVTGNLPGAEIITGDLNGDCRDDVIIYDALLAPPGQGTIRVYVGLSSGTGLTAPTFWAEVPGTDVVGVTSFGYARENLLTVDAHGTVFVTTSSGSSFGNPREVAHRFCFGADCKLVDVNGDGIKDLVAERVDGIHFLDRVEVALNDGYEFEVASPLYHELDCRSPAGCQYADLDEDGDDDAIETLTSEDAPGAFGSDVLWIMNEFRGTDNPVGVGTVYSCDPTAPPPPNATPWEPASEIPFIDVRGTAYETFALAANLDVYRLDGGSNWVQTSGSANPLVTTSTMAYARSNSGRIYRRDLDSYWTEVGRGSTRLFAGFSGLFNINPSNEVWEHWQGGWRRLSAGFANHKYAVGNYMQGWDDVNQEPLLVRRALGSWGGVERFDYGSWSWESLKGFSYFQDFIAAGGRYVYIRNDAGHIEMWTGERWYSGSVSGYRWFDVGEFGSEIAVDPATGTLFRLSADKLRIDRLEGTSGTWTRVGGPAEKIWVAQGFLYSSSPASGNLFRLPLN